MSKLAKWKTASALITMLGLFLALSWVLPGSTVLADKSKGIDIVLHGDGKMDMNGAQADIMAFNKRFMGYDKDKPGPVINLSVDSDLPMSEFYGYSRTFAERGMTRIRLQNESGVDLPHILPAAGLEDAFKKIDEADRLTLWIHPKGKFILGGKKAGAEKIVKILTARQADNPRLVLVVQTEAKTPYGRFIEGMRLVKKADMKRVAVAPPLA